MCLQEALELLQALLLPHMTIILWTASLFTPVKMLLQHELMTMGHSIILRIAPMHACLNLLGRLTPAHPNRA